MDQNKGKTEIKTEQIDEEADEQSDPQSNSVPESWQHVSSVRDKTRFLLVRNRVIVVDTDISEMKMHRRISTNSFTVRGVSLSRCVDTMHSITTSSLKKINK